jgi:hypothetical protein
MAVYNELYFACALKEDVPQQVIDLLRYLISYQADLEPQELKLLPVQNDNPLHYEITVRTSVRMGHERVASFLHWLAPYVETEGIIGFTRSDVSWNNIALVQVSEGKVYYVQVNLYADPVQVDKVKIDFDASQ